MSRWGTRTAAALVGLVSSLAVAGVAAAHVDRWIEEPSTANPNPGHPAPVLTLKLSPTRSVAPTTAAPVTTPPAGTATLTPTAAAAPTDDDDGVPAWLWIVAGLVVVAGGGALIGFLRGRSATS